MDEMEKLEQIDRYLRDELSGSEKVTFEQRLEKSPEFRQEVEDMKISQEVIRSYALREEIKSIRKAMLDENESEPRISKPAPSFRFYAVSIAASFLLLVMALGVFQVSSISGDGLYAEKAMMYQTETSRSGDESTAISAEQQAYDYYDQGNYQQYIESYEVLPSASQKAMFLAGNAYLELGNSEKAITAFRDVMEKNAQTSEKQFQEDAEYYLSLALVKNGDYEQARSLMEAIAGDSTHKYHEMISSYYLWKLKVMQWKAS